jgi:hypothetical protein
LQNQTIIVAENNKKKETRFDQKKNSRELSTKIKKRRENCMSYTEGPLSSNTTEQESPRRDDSIGITEGLIQSMVATA